MTSSRLISSSNSTNHSSASSLKKTRRRNDSSSVASLLAPELYQSGKKHCISSSDNQKFLRLHKIHCESCYCQDAPIPPLLRLPIKHQQEECRLRLPFEHQQRECHFKNTCLHRYRCLNDDKTEIIMPQAQTVLLDDEEEKGVPLSKLKVSVACQTHDEVINSKMFEEVSAFRKDCYFECHSLQNLIEDAPMHKCIHKFTINDRLMLIPINCDSFGISRCEICSKPMERCHKPHESLTMEQKPINNIRKLYGHDLVPPTLNIGSGKESIEIKVPEDVSKECFMDKVLKGRKNVPLVNSFALRFQKHRN